ncbi:unnamed protein product, partial [Amoebophrya sp. A120]
AAPAGLEAGARKDHPKEVLKSNEKKGKEKELQLVDEERAIFISGATSSRNTSSKSAGAVSTSSNKRRTSKEKLSPKRKKVDTNEEHETRIASDLPAENLNFAGQRTTTLPGKMKSSVNLNASSSSSAAISKNDIQQSGGKVVGGAAAAQTSSKGGARPNAKSAGSEAQNAAPFAAGGRSRSTKSTSLATAPKIKSTKSAAAY